VHPIELPDGRIVSLSSQHVMISSDHGLNWQAYGPRLPFTAVGISNSDFDKSFYIRKFDCGNNVVTRRNHETLAVVFGRLPQGKPGGWSRICRTGAD
jgi:hypothetical protein